ncbi:MAG TPA: sensor histidine kinase [Streptosporangiaceae bacterium]|nr:sensor histidine kinase [Streptosporangiaceae bacterium]
MNEQTDAWTLGELRWDAYFGVVLIASLIVAQIAGQASESGRLLASAGLAAMVPWYLLVGRPALYSDRHRLGRGTVYLIGLIPLLIVVQIGSGAGTFILLALCPQCFMTVPFRRAVALVVALSLTQPIVAVAQRGSAAEVATLSGVAVGGIAFSIAFGAWIMRIINQSAERAELIAQLEQTRAELAEANREAGVLAERERLASEIHDTIAQGFTSIVMLVQAAEAVIESDPAQARKQLELADRTARDNLAEARALVAGLAPTALTSATLSDALARLTDRAGQELGVKAEFSMTGQPASLGTGTDVVLLRVCQEALSNVRKHAKARSVRVRLRYQADGVSLEIADDGIGFDSGLVSEGFGLRGMRTRVAEIGGKLTVRSAHGEGTTVTAVLTRGDDPPEPPAEVA